MKQKFYFTFFLFGIFTAQAQITTPAVKAAFGVDADLRANFFNGAATLTADDWFIKTSLGPAGSGVGVIDTTGAAAILAGYSANMSNRSQSFYRTMAYMPYTIVNNSLLLDALFYRDYHDNDSTIFASGSNKNGMSPGNWSCPVSQNIPDKNDILDVFTHLRRDGVTLTDSLWLFGGISIENTTGNRYFDFELYQTDFVYNRSTRTFSGYGAEAGHTAWLFDAAGNVTRAGDIIFSAEYSSSSLTLLQARIWVEKTTMLAVTPLNFNWGGLFDGASSGAAYGYASISPKTVGAFYTGLQCVSGVWPGPFSLIRQDNSITTAYIDRQYMEFSVNLSKLGLDPAIYGINPCAAPFKRMLIKTRASTSFTAELKDFVMPFKLFDRLTVDAYTGQTYQCRLFDPTYITVMNPDPAAIYTWSTGDGTIIGPNTGTGIIAGAPGTYKVLKQVNTICPQYAEDSVTLEFDSICPLLNTVVTNLNAAYNNGIIQLSWNVSGNLETDTFIIEESTDAVNFYTAGTVISNKVDETASYTFNKAFNNSSTAVIYYRIKVITVKGIYKYSKTVAVKLLTNTGTNGLFYPNPAPAGNCWFIGQMQLNEPGIISIWNSLGKLIAVQKISLTKGQNNIKLDCLLGHLPGCYLVKLKSASAEITGKILITN